MLRRLWERWKVVARKIGDVQSRLLLCLFYVIILAPFGITVRMLPDPLQLRWQRHAHWLPKEHKATAVRENARRQF
jgi:hypothetical protein